MNVPTDPQLKRLYELSKRQLSDLIFFDEEMKFLKNLLEKYFLSKIKDSRINRVQLISRQLSQLRMVQSNITRDALMHQGNLNSKIKELLGKSIDFLIIENERVGEEISDLTRCFKNIKKDIFSVYKDLEAEELLKTKFQNHT
jgi:hypothetical protein